MPSWLAKVHPTTGTPLNATIFLGEFFQLKGLSITIDFNVFLLITMFSF